MPAISSPCRTPQESRASRLRSTPSASAELALGDERDDVEVGPPLRAGDRHPGDRGDDHAGGEAGRVEAGADGDDRLAERDDHDQPEALGEVRRRDPEAARRRARRGCRSRSAARRSRARPAAPPSRKPATISSAGAASSPGARLTDRVAVVDLRRAVGVDGDVDHPDGEVGDAEDHRVVAERLRHRQRRDQHRRHRREQPEPGDARRRSAASWSARRSRPTPTRPRPAPASPGRGPPRSGSSAIRPVTWVKAKTKTRSKKSSSGVTFCSTRPSPAPARPRAWSSSPPSARDHGSDVAVLELARPSSSVSGSSSRLDELELAAELGDDRLLDLARASTPGTSSSTLPAVAGSQSSSSAA